MKLVVTGHRPDKLGGYAECAQHAWLKARLRDKLVLLAPERVYTGMALGWDTWTADACVALNIPFVAAVPFPGQEKKWPSFAQLHYRDLLGAAVEVVTVSPRYSNVAFQRRNEWMVDRLDRGDIVLSCHDGSTGGTFNCLEYARERQQYHGIEIVNIDPREFRP